MIDVDDLRKQTRQAIAFHLDSKQFETRIQIDPSRTEKDPTMDDFYVCCHINPQSTDE